MGNNLLNVQYGVFEKGKWGLTEIESDMRVI
jgi:hypothetical protein